MPRKRYRTAALSFGGCYHFLPGATRKADPFIGIGVSGGRAVFRRTARGAKITSHLATWPVAQALVPAASALLPTPALPQAAEASSGDSTQHAGVRAPRRQLHSYSCVAPKYRNLR